MKKTSLILLTAIALMNAGKVKATHNAGMDISYQCLGGNDSFRVQISFYRACSGICAPASLEFDYRSASCGFFNGTATLVSFSEIIPYCPTSLPTECSDVCSSPLDKPDSREQYIYADTITLPGFCNDWIMANFSSAFWLCFMYSLAPSIVNLRRRMRS